jgi:acetyl-CoA carboxylase biotin carboxyl carrier protein
VSRFANTPHTGSLVLRSGGTGMPTSISAHITGTVWKIEVKPGDRVAEGQSCVIIESMKMEMPVEAPHAGVVDTIHVREGQSVSEGQALLTIT